MKRTLFILILLSLSFSSIAQSPSLTKGETISYINKQMQKVVGLEYKSGSIMESVSLSETSKGLLRFSYTASGPSKATYNAYDSPSWANYQNCPSRTYEFDPLHVKGVSLKSYSQGAVHYLTLSFVKKDLVKEEVGSCTEGQYGRKQMVHEVLFFFTMVEQKEYDRLKKAFEHLIALYKAEEDPFG